jgi:hypothetical protein
LSSTLQERGTGAVASTPAETNQAISGTAGAAWVLDVPADPTSTEPPGPRGAPEVKGTSDAGGEGRRLLSRANSRVLQWVLRDEGSALASEDLLETLDVEDLNPDIGKVRRSFSHKLFGPYLMFY